MSELTRLTIAAARDALRARAIGALELTEACLAEIEAARVLNAFSAVTAERAARAGAGGRRAARGGRGARPVRRPAGDQGPVLHRRRADPGGLAHPGGLHASLREHGHRAALGARRGDARKLNMDEFAMGSSTEHSVYGPAVSPWRRAGEATPLTPGGSSGGSAAAVAADLCLGATGTDTGGSIRQPAALTGIVGVKPTYGRCSRWGIVAFASSLDQAGPMAKTVTDAAILLGAMAGHDPKDSTSADLPVPDFAAGLAGDMRGKRIGVPKEYRVEGHARRDRSAVGARRGDAARRGRGDRRDQPAAHEVRVARLLRDRARRGVLEPRALRRRALGRRARIGAQEGITQLYERTRADGFGKEVRRRVMIGAYVLSAGYYDAYYLRAQKVRTLIRRDFEAAFAAGVDAILTPATPSAAFGIGELADADPVRMYLNDVFTVTVNLAGLPGVSIPAGLDAAGLPLGLQVIGRPWDEAGMLDAAYALERASGFVAKPTRWW
jgi:aspartyl-tRNA(Asn)/glutamyl-tRNA(Gln) amidotransferase subunit A